MMQIMSTTHSSFQQYRISHSHLKLLQWRVSHVGWTAARRQV